MDYKIAIPSYERVQVLKDKTLATLEGAGIDLDKVTIFVADESQLDKYQSGLGSKWKIEVGKPGLFKCRRFYMNHHYKAGEPILSMDDDLEKIEQLGEDNKLAELDAAGIDSLAELGFKLCAEHGSPLWGIYPARNAFYMQRKAIVGLRYVIGCCFGSFAGNKIWAKERLSDESSAEDFETCLQSWFWFQSLIRFDNVTVKTEYYAKGGIDKEIEDNGSDRWDTHEKRLRELADAYPELARIVIKAGGRVNLRLKPITHYKIPVG